MVATIGVLLTIGTGLFVGMADVVLVQRVVVSIAHTKLRVLLARHVRSRVRQRIHQSQPDDVRCGLIAGNRAADIAHRVLNASRNDGGGIKQRPVPVKGNQVVAACARTVGAMAQARLRR